MGGNKRGNKARNQTTGNHRHQDDAAWHKNNRDRTRRRAKIAKASKRKNRRKK